MYKITPSDQTSTSGPSYTFPITEMHAFFSSFSFFRHFDLSTDLETARGRHMVVTHRTSLKNLTLTFSMTFTCYLIDLELKLKLVVISRLTKIKCLNKYLGDYCCMAQLWALCRFKCEALAKVEPQSQANGLRLRWTPLVCLSKCAFLAKLEPHTSHWKSLIFS